MYLIQLTLHDGSTMADQITERPSYDTTENSLIVYSTDGTECVLYRPDVTHYTLTKMENNVVPLRTN